MLSIEDNNLSLIALPTLIPAAELPVAEALEFSVPSHRDHDSPTLALTLNYARHVGPVIRNGMLGATWTPSTTGTLTIRVRFGDSGRQIRGTLADKWNERVFVNLPESWASRMLTSVCDDGAFANWGSGLLEFSHAGLGEVGATDAVVARMAVWMAHLLQGPLDGVTEQALIELVASGDT